MKRSVHLLALVASFALVTGTAAALGSTRPDDRATHGPGAVTREHLNGLVRPDDRATHGPGAVTIWRASDTVRPDDRATHGQGAIAIEQLAGGGQVPVIAPGGSGTARVDGFDWLDAAIGAAAALGLGLIVAGGAAFLIRRAHAPAYS
jgi:hypothetical protein